MLSKEDLQLLNKLYYEDGLLFGRDRLYQYIRTNHPEVKISRRNVMDWLKSQETHQLYWPTKNTVDIRSTVLKEPHSQIGIDLVDMSNKEYKGYKWILTGYDLFSKMGYAVTMKDKTEKTVVEAMKKLLKEEIHHVNSIRSDNGSEFISTGFKKLLEDNEIKQVLSKPGKPQSNGAIERFNKTLKKYLLTSMHLKNSLDWVSIVPKFIEVYNNTENDVTKKTPNELNEEINKKTLKETRDRILKSVSSKNSNDDQKFKIGDKVRRKLEEDERTDGQSWSQDVFTVYYVEKPKNLSLSSYAYYIKDKDNKYTNKYYNNDLLKITEIQNKIEKKDKYIVSKLLKPLFKNKQPAYSVRWKYYTSKDDTIEPREQLLEDVPKIVHKFELEHNITWYKNKVDWDQKEVK